MAKNNITERVALRIKDATRIYDMATMSLYYDNSQKMTATTDCTVVGYTVYNPKNRPVSYQDLDLPLKQGEILEINLTRPNS